MDELYNYFVRGFIITSLPCLICAIDASPEEYANTLLSDPSYDKRVRPSSPTAVTLDLFVNGVSSISEISMDYSVNLFLRQRWNDPRLAYTNPLYNDSLTLHYSQYDQMWVPDLFVKNEKDDGIFHTITVPNRLLKIAPNGDILFSQRLSLKLTCYMSLREYPRDNQSCDITMETYGYTTDQLYFQWNDDNPVQISNTLKLPEFNITHATTHDCTTHYNTGSFSCQFATLHMKRLFDYYLIQVYVPSGLIVVLSWVSFWIDYHAVPARVSLGLLTVLTITTQSTGISSKLPRVSYIKAIDIWMFTCMIFVFAALIEYSIVNVLSRKDKDDADKRAKKAQKDKIPNGEINLSFDKISIADTDEESGPQKVTSTKCATSRAIGRNRALSLELVSRVMFPLVFTVFNITYWVYYY